jgi:ABC-2 type transport system ATP-binding protein
MWEFLEKLSHDGVTIILTTHYLEEAEALCDRAAIISEGNIIEVGEMKKLLAGLDEEVFVLDKEDGTSVEVVLKK